MFEYEKHIHIHMNAYLMNIVIHFVVTYEAVSCERIDYKLKHQSKIQISVQIG